MPDDPVASAIESLQSELVPEIERGVRVLSDHLSTLSGADFRAAVEALCGLFYVDLHDRPDLEASLDLAVQCLAGSGPRVVPQLLDLMQGSDIKCHLHLARTLGFIGLSALPLLRRFIATQEDPYSRSFALFAVGKIHDAGVQAALPEVVGSLLHPDKEVRDSAARTLGKIAEVVPASALPEGRRTEVFDALFGVLGDAQPAVRAKAVRSLGKMVRAGYLTAAQEERVGIAARRLLGEDDLNEWDRAYIVRREAREALNHVLARPVKQPR